MALYDIPREPSIHPTLPLFSRIFGPSYIYQAIRSMRWNKEIDEEEFQAELFKFGASILGPYLSILFYNMVCTSF